MTSTGQGGSSGASSGGGKEARTLSHQLPYPVFGVEWARHRTLIVAGGGGSSRTGVPNAVTVYKLKDGSIAALAPHRERATGEDLPYFLTALPTVGVLAVALGRRLEIWRIDDLQPLATVLTLPDPSDPSDNADPSLVAAFRDDGAALAVGGHPDGRLRVYKLRVRNPGAEVAVSVTAEVVGPQAGAAALPPGKGYRQLSFHPNGWHLLGAGEDGAWRVWALTPFGLEAEAVVPAALVPGFAKGVDVEVASEQVSEALDRGAATQYSCRCGRFSPEGDALWTVHHARRVAGRGQDRRPWLVRWRVSEGEDKRLRLAVASRRPLVADGDGGGGGAGAGAIVTALALSDDGVLGVAGDSRGQLLAWAAGDGGGGGGGGGGGVGGEGQPDTKKSAPPRALRPLAHSFAVTSLAVAPTEGVTAPATADLPPGQRGPGAAGVQAYLVASGSGDRTLRLQYVPSPKARPGVLAAWLATVGLTPSSLLAAVLFVVAAVLLELTYRSGCGWRPEGGEKDGEGFFLCLLNSVLAANHNIH